MAPSSVTSNPKARLSVVLAGFFLVLATLILPTTGSAQNLVPNPGFEEGKTGFYLFVADDSKTRNCDFSLDSQTQHSGAQSARLQAGDFARCAVGLAATIPVSAGARYRVGAWIKGAPDLQIQPGTPGVLLRLNLSANNAPSPAGLIFVYFDQTVSQGIFPATTTVALPKEWAHIEAVVEIPSGVDAVSPMLFLWKAKGSINIDDLTLESVDPATPLSPVVAGGSNPANSASAPAAPAAAKWSVLPDHANGIYGPNEQVTWTVGVTGDRTQLAAVPYVVKADGQVDIGKGHLDLSSGSATITASHGDPSVLVAQIFWPGKTAGPPIALGGAVLSPEKIQLSTPMPADFDQFWKAKLKELAAVPINPAVEKVDVSALKFSETIDFYKVTLDNVHGTHVYGQLSRPKVGEKFPAMLMLQYAGVYPLDKNQVIANAKLGWLVLNISAHDLPVDESPEFYDNLKNTTLRDYVFLGSEDRETSYFQRMFLGCARAVDYLASRPDWDGRTLLVTGGSQGGFQSFATAALCDRVTAVAVDVPAGCDFLGPLAHPPRAFGWPYWISNMGPKGRDQKKVEITAGYYDGINFAAHIHCPTLVAAGLIDDTARPTGVIAAYNAIKGPKKLVIMPLSNHHGDGNAQAAYYQEFALWRANLHDGRPVPATDGARPAAARP